MTKRVLVMLVVGILLSAPLHLYAQQAPSREVHKILGISVEGNTFADPAAIIANSGLKVGDEILIPGDQAGQAIRKLWSLRLFETVEIAIDRKMGDGVYLLITVKEFPRFDKLVIEGNDGVDKDDIQKAVTLVRGQVLSPHELKKIQRDVKKLYEKEGYLLATVDVARDDL